MFYINIYFIGSMLSEISLGKQLGKNWNKKKLKL